MKTEMAGRVRRNVTRTGTQSRRVGPGSTRPRVKPFFLFSPLPLFQSSSSFDPAHSPANEKMLFTRLSLLALASTLVSIVSGLEIIAPGGSNLWWGE